VNVKAAVIGAERRLTLSKIHGVRGTGHRAGTDNPWWPPGLKPPLSPGGFLFEETCMRPTLSLREVQDPPRVKEAKEIVAAALGRPDPAVVPWAMRITEARDAWSNAKRKGR